jgi:hypothetical protein
LGRAEDGGGLLIECKRIDCKRTECKRISPAVANTSSRNLLLPAKERWPQTVVMAVTGTSCAQATSLPAVSAPSRALACAAFARAMELSTRLPSILHRDSRASGNQLGQVRSVCTRNVPDAIPLPRMRAASDRVSGAAALYIGAGGPPALQTLAGVARQAPKTAAMERPHFDRIIGAWLRVKLMPGQLEVQPARLLNSLADDRRKGTRSTAARESRNREIPSARSEALQRICRRSRIGNGRRLRQCA